jgi:hypothetical protein
MIDYGTAVDTVTLLVNQATPTVSWSAPANIAAGTALTSLQLDASSPVSGTFTYTPGAGTVLSAGPHTLSVTFTPFDKVDYSNKIAATSITVNSGGGTWDTGTVTLFVNGSAVSSANYGQGSTTSTVAQLLANDASSGAPVTVTAVDDALFVQAKTPGAASDYSYQSAGDQLGFDGFPSAFFRVSTDQRKPLWWGQRREQGRHSLQLQHPERSWGGFDAVGNVVAFTDWVLICASRPSTL